MPRILSSRTRIETLRKEAKRWLKALRAGDARATERLRAACPQAPSAPGLRDVQHAIAREYGLPDWIALKSALAAPTKEKDADRIDTILRHGWTGEIAAARRILTRHPAFARDSLFTAATCGLVEEVERQLARDPAAATRIGGARQWTALAYVAYGRLDPDNGLAIARLLLDAGADPNFAFNDGWDNPFSLICGAIGLGEQTKPPHPQAAELVEMLVAAGAKPYDRQALYNISVAGEDAEWYQRLWALCEQAGSTEAWLSDEQGFLGKNILDYLLGNAVGQNHVARAQWLLGHGADPNTTHAYSKESLHKLAQLSGFREMTALLEAHGVASVQLIGLEALIAAAQRRDEAALQTLLAQNPGLLQAPHLLLAAAAHNNKEAVGLLLRHGADPRGVDHEGISPLHRAVQANAPEIADMLIAAGAEVDLRERKWKGTPLTWALVLGRPDMARKLAPLSRDVRGLAGLADLERLEEVLAAEPARANERLDVEDRITPLFCLPEDEDAAAAVAEILLRYGADPALRNPQGRTAADVARQRGLDDAADLIEVASG